MIPYMGPVRWFASTSTTLPQPLPTTTPQHPLPTTHTDFLRITTQLRGSRLLDAPLACHTRSRYFRLMYPQSALALLQAPRCNAATRARATTFELLPPPSPHATSPTCCTGVTLYYNVGVHLLRASARRPAAHYPGKSAAMALSYYPAPTVFTLRLLQAYSAAATQRWGPLPPVQWLFEAQSLRWG